MGTAAKKTLYDRMVEAGTRIDSHESDLYVVDTAQSRKILADWLAEQEPFVVACWKSDLFMDSEGVRWIDCPFEFDPWWHAKLEGKVLR